MNEIETFIHEAFQQNFERLALETGSAVTPDIKAAALEQVLLYYRKMRDVAENVTETEVRLTLPEQKSLEGRRFTLQGVVDIVREDERTVMYDVKTHFDVDTAKAKLEPYTKQLNVYAHIWQELRGQELDATGIIATKPTRELRAALRGGNDAKVDSVMTSWNPCIEIDLNKTQVQQIISEFGEVVDKIERRDFRPPPVEVLLAPSTPGGKSPFGTEVCRNCDVRFSCNSFRQFAIRSQGGQRADLAINYFLGDYGPDFERSEWMDANLETLGRNELDDLGPAEG